MHTNEWVVGRLGQKPCLLEDINRRKLSFVGHVIRNKGLGCDLITGMVFGKQKRGRPKMRFVDSGDWHWKDCERGRRWRKLEEIL